jgi:glycine dehydrogenase subunit 1
MERVPGVRLVNRTFFNEFAVRLSRPTAEIVDALADKAILAGVPVSRFYPERGELADILLVAATELTTDADIDRLVEGLREVLS